MERGRIITTGVKELDSLVPGYRQGTLNIIGGRPAAGKTSYALETTAMIAINKNMPVLYVSLAEGADKTKKRMYELCPGAESELDKASIIFEDGCNRLDDLVKRAKELIKEKNIGVVVVDYLQLVKTEDEKLSEQHSIRELRRLAEENNVVIVLLSLLNLDFEKRSDHRLYLTDFDNYECMMMNSEKIFMIQNENGKKTYYLHSYKSEDNSGMSIRE
ncbi:DnaB-like helicase C-terminal domain-containing protein [Butyrivibrio sp. AE3004]|uniref:DnaB-like helicase C-terminal domain-containing protein n=1 Tax=Butyrivibrio sp. AE3004 TaxID=1506994 RepID=UPI00049470C9|nr:DnaB-like helicase C-terminal domain-containing protein [Butyrivibrio sp. AE3004]